jgi:hypothetical protein
MAASLKTSIEWGTPESLLSNAIVKAVFAGAQSVVEPYAMFCAVSCRVVPLGVHDAPDPEPVAAGVVAAGADVGGEVAPPPDAEDPRRSRRRRRSPPDGIGHG